MKHASTIVFTAIGIFLLCAAASAAEPDKLNRLFGAPTKMGAGVIRTYVDVGADGTPRNVGIVMTGGALRNLPTEGGEACCGGHEYSLPMPSGAPTPFTHAVVNWNPQGHEPAGIYDKPHFDFHFYMISEAERRNIKESHGEDRVAAMPPPPAALPANYVQAPGIVGRMGAHWVDTTAPEFNGKPFTTTFIYGSYNGRVSFIEPMITKAFLESCREVVMPIPQPATPIDPRFQPARYAITNNPDTGEISVELQR